MPRKEGGRSRGRTQEAYLRRILMPWHPYLLAKHEPHHADLQSPHCIFSSIVFCLQR